MDTKQLKKELKDKDLLIKELENLNFAEFIYCEDLDEGFLEVRGKSKYLNFLCKVFSMGRWSHNHIVIQILKDKENSKHYIFFDELNKLETIEQVYTVLNIVSKYALEVQDE